MVLFMKLFVQNIIIVCALMFIMSCGEKGSYYEQITKEKSITSRIVDLNKTIDEIRIQENGTLIKDGINIIKYVYYIGDGDTYIVSYLFDEKGCFEIGLKSYFGLEEDTKNVLEGFKTEINSSEFILASDDNYLYRWLNANKSVSIEIDYKDTSRGLLVVSIFANE